MTNGFPPKRQGMKKTLNKYRFSRRFSIAVSKRGGKLAGNRMIPFLLILLEDDAQKTNK